MNPWKVLLFFAFCVLAGVITITAGSICITIIGEVQSMIIYGMDFNYSMSKFKDDLQYGLICGSLFGILMFFLFIYYKKKGY